MSQAGQNIFHQKSSGGNQTSHCSAAPVPERLPYLPAVLRYHTACLHHPLHKCPAVQNGQINKIKIVVVDDGSTDESEKICDRYKQKMTVIHQEHKGLIAARERGLREADTKYVTFVDADDFIAGGMYEYMLSKADEYDADIVTCGCIRYWNEDDYAYDLCSEFQEGIY